MAQPYSERYYDQIIIEWKSCYLDYEELNNIGEIYKKCIRQKMQLQEIKRTGTRHQIRSSSLVNQQELILSQDHMQNVECYHNFFTQKGEWAHNAFVTTYYMDVDIYAQFVRWKFKQIKKDSQLAIRFYFMGGDLVSKSYARYYRHFLQSLYIQSSYLCYMIQSNIQAQRRILTKHRLYNLKNYPIPESKLKLQFNIDQVNMLRRNIQKFYYKTVTMRAKQKSRRRLEGLVEKQKVNPIQTFIVGLLLGTVITIIIAMIIILKRADITLQTDPIFNQQFPLWRGISYIIFYLWCFGYCLVYLQKHSIHYNTVLQNTERRQLTSAIIFKIAGFFSITFIILFVLYSLQIADLYQLGMAPQWLPLFIWIPFILFVINPLPIFYYEARLYYLKMFIQLAKSILYYPRFPAVFLTLQALSSLNAFQDFVYMICYYTSVKLPFPQEQILYTLDCRYRSRLARFIYTLVFQCLRLNQLIRTYIYTKDKKYIVGVIRMISGIITTALAYAWSSSNNPSVFPAWITFAVINTVFASYWDIKSGWALLKRNSKNRFLRDHLIFRKANYYVWIVVNTILRCAWTLNISPNIVRNFFVSPQLFILAFGFLELIRRNLWNVVKIQSVQVENNKNLNVLSKWHQKCQKNIKDYVESNNGKVFNQGSQQYLCQSQLRFFLNEQPSQKNDDIQKQKQSLLKNIKEFQQYIKSQSQTVKINKEEVNEKVKDVLVHVY